MISLIIVIICAYFFYQAGKIEGNPKAGRLWAMLSVLVWIGSVNFIARSLIVALLSQGALFIGIGIYRARQK